MKHHTELHEKEIKKKDITVSNLLTLFIPVLLLCIYHAFFNVQTDCIYQKNLIEIHATWLTSELKTPLPNVKSTLSVAIWS